ncbi:beta-N-acetylhexosaminidase [Thalassomonas actiniarum]|uniref:Beta-hexosaminidase n=1 Tax=Thalassomonas actiniarum TaxID=485447 RepID=A0AAE9YUS4_9GAMM|nr:beta-N-acetylhexosaminidase [Thalassomonas actiniarum]WDE01203.1 beta-N-acetylhexosaminidase [Thalassomonas actiniarum]
MGPIMLDVQGTSLSAEDKELLEHPRVGGCILFSRNYHSPQQMTALTQDIRAAAGSDILLAVDHEGGRVQRFREHFTAIPAMGSLWSLAGEDKTQAVKLAHQCGVLMALEVQAVGIDISFAPVLDINGISEVIGDRAFHQQTDVIIPLATAFIDGMNTAGMLATGKHFPGHGSVKEDSHIALPVDSRSFNDITGLDLKPFKVMLDKGALSALMPAHVIYPDIDKLGVGFSAVWLQKILRQTLGFDGVIFSDDLSMEGAAVIGGYVERAEAAQQAGCDMLLVCNNRKAAVEVIDNANISNDPSSSRRLGKLLKKTDMDWAGLAKDPRWQQASRFLENFL